MLHSATSRGHRIWIMEDEKCHWVCFMNRALTDSAWCVEVEGLVLHVSEGVDGRRTVCALNGLQSEHTSV